LADKIVEWGLRGVTSNPTIFEKAIGGSDDYDEAFEELASEELTPDEAFERIAVADIQAAADLFRGIYDESGGTDGFVSLEVSPELAREPERTIHAAHRLWRATNRPNVMIKVPGTADCLPAIEQLLFDGLNINVTLLFSREGYGRVVDAYLRGIQRRTDAGEPVDRISSVASFFISRVDSAVDERLHQVIEATDDEGTKARARSLLGRAGIANAKLAYQHFEEVFGGERFESLREAGAQVQRPLWASTSTKDPSYRDVMYVEELIGPQTVNTMPLETLEAYADHGLVRRSVDERVDEARAALAGLEELGIDLDDITDRLQEEGVEKFAKSYRSLLETVAKELSRTGASS
jgi:transaldolase